MALVSNAAAVAKRLQAAPKAIEDRMRVAVVAGAEVIGQAVRHNLPSSGRLRNVGGQGGKPIGVAVSVKGRSRISALIRATGPVHLLEGDTKPHDITARRRAGALNTPHGPRRKVRHPGTQGQRPFAKGVAAGAPIARKIVEDAFRDAPRSFL